MNLPDRVRVYEVGPRDGLQNEPAAVPVATRVELVERLADCGFPAVEAAAFVSPRRVPQMEGSAEVMAGIRRRDGVAYPVLVPNLRGLEDAKAAGVDTVCLLAGASETFQRNNVNASIGESLDRAEEVAEAARAASLRVRGYVSCVLGCPYEGEVAPSAVVRVAERLAAMGCEEISLGDTIGRGTPTAARRMAEEVAARVPAERLAAHFHDTYGQALPNLLAVLGTGIATVDSAVGGLGGCPYAPGAGGNVATEDVLYMLHGMGIGTGIDLDRVVETAWFVCERLGREPAGRVARALRPGARPGDAA